jgi:hypothetical protein
MRSIAATRIHRMVKRADRKTSRKSRKMYPCPKRIVYYSPRFKKTVTVPEGYLSDGASGPAADIYSKSWWVHDVMCDLGKWDDDTRCTNFEASKVLSDILKSEGRNIRSFTWFWATYLFGGGAARKNGMKRLK